MRLIDTHAHLDEESFDVDRPEVLNRAASLGVVGVLSLGTTLDSSRRAAALALSHSAIRAAVGVHPNYILAAALDDWEQIVQLAREPHVVAIGETGLDLYWKTVPLDVQRDWFRRHLQLSRELGKPFSVHCRDAEEPVLEELRRAAGDGPLRGVMHSFAGSAATARECVQLGLHISFSGILTYKKSALLRELAREIPPDRLLVETDAPYLSPQPVRGKRNEPGFARHTAEVLAETRGMSLSDLAEITTGNAERLFACRWGE